jgi:hypothetical protein
MSGRKGKLHRRSHMAGLTAVAGLSALAVPALAETQVTNTQSAPIATSTANAGAPDDVTITAAGALRPASGTALTLDSNNAVSNAGSIVIQDQNNSTAIGAVGGHTGSISNSNLIEVDETTVDADLNGDGILDGPFAKGSGRYGIHVTGPGAFTGSITNTATGGITVRGNDSSGISVETDLVGSIINAGTVTVTGDRSFGLRTTGAVSGDVNITGVVTATGQGAVGTYLGGNVGGGVIIGNTLTSNGYRSDTAPATTDLLSLLRSDDLLQAGSALVISGDVGRGLLIDTINATTATAGAVVTYGSAPAVVIGAMGRDVSLGNVSADADPFGVVIRGTVDGLGVYSSVAANGVQLGVDGGGAVRTGGGIRITGAIQASAVEGTSTALHLNNGASAPTILNSGSITANMTGVGASSARAILLEAGAQGGILFNSGTISADVSGTAGDAIAVRDLSGTINDITNTGKILAGVGTAGATITGKDIALDLSNNTSGVNLKQAVTDTTIVPEIGGSILLGSGNDNVQILGGSVAGDIVFAGGINSLTIDGGASVLGAVTTTGSLALTVGAGSLTEGYAGKVALSSLNLGAGSTLILTADPANGSATELDVAGAANVASGAKIGLRFDSLLKTSAVYTLIHANSLTAGEVDQTLLGQIPYLYTAHLESNPTAGTINIDIARKTAADLALPASVAAAYEPMIQAVDRDAGVREAFLVQTDRAGLMSVYNQMLPNHSGGVFEVLSAGADSFARAIDDRAGPDAGGVWVQETGFGMIRDGTTDLPGYKGYGFGLIGGTERGLGKLGIVGLTLGASFSQIDDDQANAAEDLSVNMFEGGGYWRAAIGGLAINGRLAASYLAAKSARVVSVRDTDNTLLVSRTANGDWSGWTAAARVAASYEARLGIAYARPTVSLDYFRVDEGAYSESGGGDAVNLAVDDRTTSRATEFAGLALGARFGGEDAWWGPEITLGYRDIQSGEAGDTTARFLSGGSSFTLLADEVNGGGPVARFAVKSENGSGAFALEGGAEKRDDLTIYDLRMAAHFSF